MRCACWPGYPDKGWTRILPLGALLVEHTVTAVLAANLVTTLERDTRRALAAKVNDRGAVDSHSAESVVVAEGVLSAHRGDLVGFAGHFEYGVLFLFQQRMCKM